MTNKQIPIMEKGKKKEKNKTTIMSKGGKIVLHLQMETEHKERLKKD